MITQYFDQSSLLYHRDRYADRSIPHWPLPCLIHKSIPPRSVHDGGGGLLAAKHVHVLNIHVCRTADHKGNDFGHIAAFQRLKIVIHLRPAFFVIKSYLGELGFFYMGW